MHPSYLSGFHCFVITSLKKKEIGPGWGKERRGGEFGNKAAWNRTDVMPLSTSLISAQGLAILAPILQLFYDPPSPSPPATSKPSFPPYWIFLKFWSFSYQFSTYTMMLHPCNFLQKPLVTFKILSSLPSLSQIKRWSFKYQVLSFIEL